MRDLERRLRSEGGSALLVTMLLLVMLGLIGFAALDTVTRDQRVAHYQNRKKIAFYAAEAGVSEALQTLTLNGTPTVGNVSLADSTTYPHGQPSYAPDPTAATPIESIGFGAFPGMNLAIGQNGSPLYQMQFWRVRVQGSAPGGSVARLEFASGALISN